MFRCLLAPSIDTSIVDVSLDVGRTRTPVALLIAVLCCVKLDNEPDFGDVVGLAVAEVCCVKLDDELDFGALVFDEIIGTDNDCSGTPRRRVRFADGPTSAAVAAAKALRGLTRTSASGCDGLTRTSASGCDVLTRTSASGCDVFRLRVAESRGGL